MKSKRSQNIVHDLTDQAQWMLRRQRLRKQSHKARNREIIADLRLATCYLRALAALRIAEEAEVASDPAQKQQLRQEAAELRIQAR